jgi:DNA polymerase-1
MDLKELVPSELNPPLNASLVTNSSGLDNLSHFLKHTNVFGYDLETPPESVFHKRKIRTIQFGDKDAQFVIDLLAFAGSPERLSEQGGRTAPEWAEDIVKTIRPALDSNAFLKVGVGLEFEYVQTLWCLGIRSWHFYDCLLVEKVLNCGKVDFFAKNFWGMEDMSARYLKIKVSKEYQKSFDLCTPLSQGQIEYAALDTRIPLALMKAQSATVASLKVERVVQIENNAVPAFGDMHLNGFYLDRDAWMEQVSAQRAQHIENVKELDRHFIPVVGTKERPVFDLAALEAAWRDEKDKTQRAENRKAYQAACRAIKEWDKESAKYEGEAAINYSSNDQLLKALRQMGFGEKKLKNTDDKSLSKHSDKPVIRAIQNYRESKTSLTRYGEKFLDYIDPVTGRIHANHNQIGAETGRPSCTKPNLYNIPKKNQYRHPFKARPGYKMLRTDESGAELRILADITKDPVWIAAFENDWDVHSIVTQMMKPEEWEAGTEDGCEFVKSKQKCECKVHLKMRDDIKATNFGVAYGMEVYALAARLGVSLEVADALLKLWRKKNKHVNDGLTKLGNDGKMKLQARTYSGRVRFFNKPTWEKANEIAIERAKERGKSAIGSGDVSKVYYSMYGAIERESKNTPIQGGNADIIKEAMGCGFDKNGKPFMWHLLPQYNAELVNHVYDEVDIEAPDETVDGCQVMVEDCIERAGAEFMTSVVMKAESKISEKWTK